MSDDLFEGRRARRKKQEAADSDPTGETVVVMSSAEKEYVVAVAQCERHLAEIPAIDSVTLTRSPTDPLQFQWTICPTEGYWKGGKFTFHVVLPNNFPYSSPVIVLKTPVWHPNIDTQGKPCLSVIQKGWVPTNTLTYVIYGLTFLFQHPNSEDPLNLLAADEMRNEHEQFLQHVKEYLVKAAKADQ